VIPVIIYFLPTLLAAWIGWRWKGWKGVFIAVMALWLVFIAAGVLFFTMMGPSLQDTLESYPPPAS